MSAHSVNGHAGASGCRPESLAVARDWMQRLEESFDVWFGAAANPWRHLGALGFLFFWLIAATGIYLYAVFDTSVQGAYASVAIPDAASNGGWAASCAACTATPRMPSCWSSCCTCVRELIHRPLLRLSLVHLGDGRAAAVARAVRRHRRASGWCGTSWRSSAPWPPLEWLDWLNACSASRSRATSSTPTAWTTASSRCSCSCTSVCRCSCCWACGCTSSA